MVKEAILTQHTDGRWRFGKAHEADAGTIDDWLSDAAPGIGALAAPELTDAIQDRNGGLPFCITDESATEGPKTFYVIVWQD